MPCEFEFIDNLKVKYSLDLVGDDCAVLPKDAETDLLLTADMLVEDVDFRIDWTTPEFLGHKALAVSLSDIAAMGGQPKWGMLSIGVPEELWKTDFLDRFYDGWFALAGRYGVQLAGGDISRSPDKLVIDSIVGGEIARGRAVPRSGARAGDSIYLSGALGGASAGLELLKMGRRFETAQDDQTLQLILKQLQPFPQLRLANLLQQHEISSAMIDISDGLSSDLHHIARASGVGCRIYAENIPIDADLIGLGVAFDALGTAFHGGEDFELLFTADDKKISALHNSKISRIGEITANIGIIEVIDGGKIEILEPKGYRHFR